MQAENQNFTTEELEELQRVAQNSINNVVEQTKEDIKAIGNRVHEQSFEARVEEHLLSLQEQGLTLYVSEHDSQIFLNVLEQYTELFNNITDTNV